MKKNINYILLLIFLLFYNGYMGYSQLTVDAGPDNAVCFNEGIMDSINLGGNPTALGGSGSYTYCWETLYHLSGSQYYWYASYFLDDTTSTNPKLLHHTLGSDLVFHLTVTDSEDNVEIDSCRIIFSFINVSIMDVNFYVPRGDSTILCYDNLIGSKLPLDSLAWIPQYGVSSPHDPCTWVHPDTSTSYAVYIRDTAGCFGTSAPAYHIYIVPASINESTTPRLEIVYNMQERLLQITGWENMGSHLILSLYNLSGHLLLNKVLTQDMIPLYNIDEPMVIYTLYKEQRLICAGKLVLFNN